jgi:HAD superfamily hydrolase (TIGR01549 family)
VPIRAFSLDLFDTLVDLSFEGLPRVRIAGEERPSTLGAVHAVLSRHENVPFEAFAEAVRDVDRAQREARYREGVEISSERRFAEVAVLLGLAGEGLARALAAAHMELLRAQASVPAHHPGLLARLAERAPVGICSNFTDAATARRILEEQGLLPHLGAVVVSDEVGFRKPRREIFAALLDALGVAAAETLHVGDNLAADVAGAAALGMRTAWLTRRIPDPEAQLARHRGPRPELVLRDLEDLLGVLPGAPGRETG